MSLSWLEISTSAFNNNAYHYKKAIGNNGILAPVLKGDAYGHGMLEMGQLCEKNQYVDWICVLKLSEALTLRSNGVNKPILVLGIIDDDPNKAINKQIEFSCFDLENASELNQIAQKNRSRINIHLKIDTGLSRFGIYPDQTISLIHNINQLSHIVITGIWSHCAESYKEDQTFTRLQIDQFKSLLMQLEQKQINIPIKHMGNSAATTAHDLSFCNFFRVGLGIYGYWPSESTRIITQKKYPDFTLSPIATWKTRILEIKQVKKGTSIGYDRTYIASEDMTIALLPIGYADGYNPFLSHKGHVIIDNIQAPLIGRVAMNIVTIDISHIKNAHKQQEVILLNNHDDQNYDQSYDNNSCNAQTIADFIEIKNPRYITTSIKSSVPKIIVPDLLKNEKTEQITYQTEITPPWHRINTL